MSIDNYLIDLAKSTANNVSTDIASDLTPKIEPVENSVFSKVGLLQERTQQKLADLSKLKTDYTNTMSDLEFQTLAGQMIADKQVIKDPTTGETYQIGQDGKRVPFNGNARWLYQFGSPSGDDVAKIGQAEDIVDRQFVQPERRYTPTEGSNYGWASGPKGVDLADRQMAILMPDKDALTLEGLGHARQLAQQNKLIAGLKDDERQAMKSQLGAGYTEFYKDPTGFWGDTSQATPAERKTALESAKAVVKSIDEPRTVQTAGPLGSISKKYESRGDVATIAPDTHNTTSYGVYQLNSAGTIQNFLQSPEGIKFGKQLAGYEVGTPEFNNRYKKLATNFGPALEQAQEAYIKRTHFDPLNQKAQEFGIDTSDKRVQEALWSQSVQHTPEGNEKILQNAISKLNNQSTSADLIRALYESRIDYTQGLTTIDAETKAQLADRYANEYVDVLNSAPTNVGTENEKQSIGDKIVNFPKAIAQGFIKTGILDTVDFVGEATGLWDIGTGDEKEALTKHVTDYNSKYADKYMKANEILLTSNFEDIPEEKKGWFDKAIEDVSGKDGMLNNINKLISNLDYEETTEILSNAFANTDTTGYSIGMLLGLVVGTKGAGLGKVAVTGEKTAQASIQAIKNSTALNKAQKTAAIGNVYKEAYENASILQKSINQIGKNSGLLTINAGQVNDQLDEFEKNTGRKATAQEVVEKYLLNLGGLLLDRTVDVGLIKGAAPKETIAAISNLIKYTPNNTGLKLAQDSMKFMSKLALAGGTEFLQEGTQTAIEELNKIDIRTDKGQEQYKEKAVEILNGAFAGVGGAVHMASPVAGYEYVKDVTGTFIKNKVPKQEPKPVGEEATVEAETPINVIDTLATLRTKVNGGERLSNADIVKAQKLEAMPELKEDERKQLNEIKAAHRAQLLANNNNEDNADTTILKSKRDLMYALEDLGELTEEEDKILYAKAKKAGIVKNEAEYAKVKKDFATVELEATTGKRGYITQMRELDALLEAEAPDANKIKKQIKQLSTFETSQKVYLEKAAEAKLLIDKKINDFNASKGSVLGGIKLKPQEKVQLGKWSWNFNIENSDKPGEAKLQASSLDGLNRAIAATEQNISGIAEGLQSVASRLEELGLNPEETGVTGKPIIDPKGKAWVEKFAKELDGSDNTPKATHIYVIGSGERAKTIKESNISKNTNAINYTKDSVVYITMDRAKTQKDVDVLKKELSDKTSELHKAINAAKTAGATIRLDTTLRAGAKDKFAKSALHLLQQSLTSFGNVYRSIPSGKKGSYSYIFKPKAEVLAIKEAAKKAKEAKEEVDRKVDVEAYTRFRDAVDEKAQEAVAKEVWENNPDVQKQYKGREAREATVDENGKEKPAVEAKAGWELVLNRFSTVSNNSKKIIKNILNTITSLEDSKLDNPDNDSDIDLENILIDTKIISLKNALEEKYHAKDVLEVRKEIDTKIKKMKSIGNVLNEIKEARESDATEEVIEKNIREIREELGRNMAQEILDESISKGYKDDIEEVITEVDTEVKKGVKKSKRITPLDINRIIKVGKESILSIAPVEELFTALKGHPKISSVKYIEEFKDSMGALFKVGSTTKNKVSVKGVELPVTEFLLDIKDSPAIGLFYDKDTKLNDTVVFAGLLALDEYFVNNGNMLGDYKSMEDAAQMVGVPEFQLGRRQYELIKDKGVFQKTLANKLGSATLRKMGYVFKKDATEVERQAYDRLAADVGIRIVGAALHRGMLVQSSVSVEAYQTAIKKDSGDETKLIKLNYIDKGDADIHFVKFSEDFNKKDHRGVSLRSTRSDVYKEIHELLGDENTFRKEPSAKPIKNPRHIKEQVSKDIAGMKIPATKKKGSNLKSPSEFIKSLVDIKWEFNRKIADRLLQKVNIDVLKKHLGYATEEDLAKMHLSARESAIAQNRDIDKSIEELNMFTNSRGETDVAMYFDWFYSSNGRYMMDSNTLNPQTDKLHRFLIQPAAHKIQYRVKNGVIVSAKDSKGKDINVKDMKEFTDYAIAQAFGFKVDKKGSAKITEAAELLSKVGPKKLQKLLFGEDEHASADDVVLKFKLKMAKDGKVEIVLPTTEDYKTSDGIEFEPDHISHTMQAIDMLENIKRGGTFESYLTAEFDAVTSGFGLKLLQIPILEDIWNWLNKVGVFGKNQKLKRGMNDILDEVGFFDSYQTLAIGIDVTTESIKKVMEKPIKGISAAVVLNAWEKAGLSKIMPKVNEIVNADDTKTREVTSALRALFKDPFMTFNYSAGIASIKRSLAGVLTNGLLDKIMDNDEGTKKIVDLIVKHISVVPKEYKIPKNAKELVALLKEVNIEKIWLKGIVPGKVQSDGTIKDQNVSLETYLHTIMDATYGAEVERIMTDKFKPFMEVHAMANDSFKVMFVAWKDAYNAKVKAVPYGELSDKKVEEILDELREMFPLIKSPLSDVPEEGIAIYKNTSETPNDANARYLPTQAPTNPNAAKKAGLVNKKGQGVASLKVRHMIRAFDAAISSGSVVPIHYIDGALMAQLTGHDITAIHDAVMPPLHESKEVIKKYNKAMYEVSKQYNWIGEIAKMLGNLDNKELSKDTKVGVRVKNEKGALEEKEMNLVDAVNTMKETVNTRLIEINARRDEVFAEIGYIGHMVGVSDSMWMQDGVNIENDILSEEQITKLKGIFMDNGKLRPVIAELANKLNLDMKGC